MSEQPISSVAAHEGKIQAQDKAQNHKHLIAAMTQLRTQNTRQSFLNNVANANSNVVWLKSVKDQGGNIVIDGIAASSGAVSK